MNDGLLGKVIFTLLSGIAAAFLLYVLIGFGKERIRLRGRTRLARGFIIPAGPVGSDADDSGGSNPGQNNKALTDRIQRDSQ